MTQQHLLRILLTYEEQFKEILFTATEAAARTDNEQYSKYCDILGKEIGQNLEVITAILKTVEETKEAEKEAEELWKAGKITKAEKEKYIKGRIFGSVTDNTHEQVEKIAAENMNEGATMNKHGFVKDISIFSNYVPAASVVNYDIFILYSDYHLQWVWRTKDNDQANAVEKFIKEKMNAWGEIPENIKELIQEEF